MKTLLLRSLLPAGFLIPLLLPAFGQPGELPLDKNRIVRETLLSEGQLRDFRELTEQKIAEFQRYLTVIADPGQQDNIRELAIENARMLFMPDATMQVGSVRPGVAVNTYPLPVYLRRLKNLDGKYVSIRVTFYDLALVGDWASSAQGYTTTATYFQRFRAFDRKGRIVYGAKTAKQLMVDLQNRKDTFYEEHRWTVLLGNVQLVETTPGH